MIPLNKIHPSALFAIETLQKNGFEAYLVGGAVRDLLINREPKDFDVVTNATNSQIAGLFDNCELIGRRFPIALVKIGEEVIEISTYVSNDIDQSMSVILKRERGEDRLPGTLAEDSSRRDFTINAIYFNPSNNQIIDLEGGVEDLNNRRLKFIGSAEEKVIEDPVRIIRAIRQSYQLNLSISNELEELFLKYCKKIDLSSKSRLAEEVSKIFNCTFSYLVLKKLIEMQVFSSAFPQLFTYLTEEFSKDEHISLKKVLETADGLVKQFGKLRESSLFAFLAMPYVYREFGDIWLSQTHNFELSDALNEKFRGLWIELNVKKWAKSKVIDMYFVQWRFVFPKDKNIKSVFVHKEYFVDAFRLFRFYTQITNLHLDYLQFWDHVRKHPDHIELFLRAFKSGANYSEIKLTPRAKSGHFWRKKKKRPHYRSQ